MLEQPGHKLGAWIIFPEPPFDVFCVHVHCAAGQSHVTPYVVAPHDHDALVVHDPSEPTLLLPLIGVQVGGGGGMITSLV